MSQNGAGPGQSTGSSGGGPFDMIRPQQIANLPVLSDPEKAKFSTGLQKLWSTVESNGADTDVHQKAVNRIKEVSRELMIRIAKARSTGAQAQGRPASQGQQPAQAQPQNNAQAQRAQAQAAQHMAQTAQSNEQQRPPSQQAAGVPAQPQPGANQALQQQSQLSESARTFLSTFKVYPSPDIQPGGEAYGEYARKVRTTLQTCLMTHDKYNKVVQEITAREARGETSQALTQAKENARQVLDRAKKEFETAKAINERNRIHWTARQGKPDGAQGAMGTGDMNAGNAPNQMAQQQQAQQMQGQQQKAAGQQQQTRQIPTDAQSGQFGGGVAQTPGGGQMSPGSNVNFHQNQNQGAPAMHASHSQQGQVQMGQQAGQQPMSARPQPMPQQNQYAAQHATSQMGAGQAGGSHPQPLTHQAAMSAAARTYSEQQARTTATPTQSASGSSFPTTSLQTTRVKDSNLPINKQLNVPPPSPVAMGPTRPTFGGPGNGPAGMMGQPAMAKAPQFILEGEGERVLSKKKLDELVRQVTGGGDGDGLTPDVEEAVLTLADDFVENVITAACRLAKIRPDSTLDVRDIQIVLERNYNIRVPGYSLDEVRTVRKFQPAAGWTQKMNAVQAAKVMGKNEN